MSKFWGGAALLAAMLGSDWAVAGERPSVRFHAGELIECRDVTPEAFAANNPGEKIVEARFRVSVLVAAGDPRDVSELLFTFASPGRRVRVIDFLPRTELTTDQAGPKELVATRERQDRLDLGLGGDLTGGFGPVKVTGKPNVGAGTSNHDTVRETYRQLPSLELLVASGTTAGEHGAFFKMRRSTQATLEGTHDFCCLFAVPCQWRGDWLQVGCRAQAEVTQYLSKRTEPCGESVLTAGCYLAGDGEAKFAAQRLAEAQAEVREGREAASAPRSWAAMPPSPAGLFGLAGHFVARPVREESSRVDPRAKLAQALSAMASYAGGR